MANNWLRAERQAEGRERVLQAIVDLTARGVRPPNRVEIAAETGMSISTIKRHVAVLIEQGKLVDDGGGHRSLHLP